MQDPGYRELYVRWMQYGVFLPMFRSHGTDTPREIWNFGEPGSVFYEAIRDAINLRYRLMPYIYTWAGRVTWEHATMLRSLLFDFGHDEQAGKLDGEFMFGGSILVCPVTSPMFYDRNGEELEGNTDWNCYLPEGCGWYDYWDGRYWEGGQWVTVDAKLDRIPLFVRAGSILPLETGLTYAQQETGLPLEIRIYPGADSVFRLYEDAGEGYEYESGEYQWISLEWKEETRVLRIGACSQSFPQGMRGRRCRVTLQDTEREFLYTGEAVEISLS